MRKADVETQRPSSKVRLWVGMLIAAGFVLFGFDTLNREGQLLSRRRYLDCAKWQLVDEINLFGHALFQRELEILPFKEIALEANPPIGDCKVLVSTLPLGWRDSRLRHRRLLGYISDLKLLSDTYSVAPDSQGIVQRQAAEVINHIREQTTKDLPP